jgi:Ni,Fe-hydrogenase maturation factor
MGRRRPGNTSFQKTNNLIEDLVGNSENEYPVPDPNRTIKNITNEFRNAHKKVLMQEIMDEITEKLTKKLQNTVDQKVQNVLKNIKTQQIKNLRRHRKN